MGKQRIHRRKRLNFDSLMNFLDYSRREVRRCGRARAYLAGIILMGAALEFALTGLMRAWPNVVYGQGKKLVAHWDLKSLNQFARTVGWLDYRAFLAAERIRKHRNLVHPNWVASESRPHIKKSLFLACENDLDDVWRSINFWLFGDST